ncbi:MAG: GDP-mannose 4,6-dehydratase [Clostridia bacterium]|nr:GDP-mannose 4,6-dehydratase [Deltaproteobacteria bacterium]
MTKKKRALITGITGQDGSYLAELLLEKDYEVFGLIRRASTFNTSRIDHIYADPHTNPALKLVYGDLSDGSSLNQVLRQTQPDEVYNLGAQSHVRVSFDIPEYTGDVTGLGTLRMLEALRETGIRARFYQASSSELYGAVLEVPQRESTPFNPRSPYAAAKAYAFYIVANYRDAYGMHASNGILFNHESERRGETFVSRKITRAVAHIKHGLQDKLFLGNMDSKRDWGYAPDYVKAMWMMLQADEPDDYVIATGVMHTVREMVELAFATADLDWNKYVEIDPRYFRPTEVEQLLGDSTKARKALDWKPEVGFEELVKRMVKHDLELVRRKVEGHRERTNALRDD